MDPWHEILPGAASGFSWSALGALLGPSEGPVRLPDNQPPRVELQRAPLGPSQWPLGAVLGPFGHRLGAFFGFRLGAPSKPQQGPTRDLAAVKDEGGRLDSWTGPLGALTDTFWNLWGPVGAPLGPSWGPLEAPRFVWHILWLLSKLCGSSQGTQANWEAQCKVGVARSKALLGPCFRRVAQRAAARPNSRTCGPPP
eukprot:742746-Pyramimonas_sp.AAC.1